MLVLSMSILENEFFIKLSSFWFFHRWHPEVALRYLPLVDKIKKLGNVRILDVGSGGLGIAPYLKRPITGVDVNFSPPFSHFLKRVKGSALNLPFADRSFEIVVCVDMLEHLTKEERKKAIEEMLRVAQKNIMIAVPCGKKAYGQDCELDYYYKKQFGREYIFLAEQLEFGLPQKDEILKMIRKAAQKKRAKIKIEVEGNENLSLRKFLMMGWTTNNLFTNIFFRKILLLAIPLFRFFGKGKTYRQLFFVEII